MRRGLKPSDGTRFIDGEPVLAGPGLDYPESFYEALSIEPDADGLWRASLPYLRDGTSGFAELETFAKRGSPLAAYWVGEAYRDGTAGETDRQAAIRWFETAADRGLAEGRYQIARMFWLEGNVDQAIPILNQLADQGHAISMFNLAKIFIIYNSKRDIKKSRSYFLRAIAAGNLSAQKDFALFLIVGKFGGLASRLQGLWLWLRTAGPYLATCLRFPASDRISNK